MILTQMTATVMKKTVVVVEEALRYNVDYNPHNFVPPPSSLIPITTLLFLLSIPRGSGSYITEPKPRRNNYTQRLPPVVHPICLTPRIGQHRLKIPLSYGVTPKPKDLYENPVGKFWPGYLRCFICLTCSISRTTTTTAVGPSVKSSPLDPSYCPNKDTSQTILYPFQTPSVIRLCIIRQCAILVATMEGLTSDI